MRQTGSLVRVGQMSVSLGDSGHQLASGKGTSVGEGPELDLGSEQTRGKQH